jgi:hypothetical protein
MSATNIAIGVIATLSLFGAAIIAMAPGFLH